ncbi:MAG: NAD(P)/FAD-dependent oxidoreductase [Frankiaceae bacterium]|nr:NAD(P)/FAD-dependent oxidoreductase [Frankiaceae bacterium]MBV9869452.1 NAD(P)/FAD-dependent oxidoreductase [Frankiaceae bacterium]
MRILVLGAGFGGLEIATLLSDEFGADLDLTLIDKSEGFIFGFSKLDVMFGRSTPDHVLHRYAELVKPGVRFVPATIRSIDVSAKRVSTDAGDFGADIIVVALGADLDPAATPGLVEGGHEFYSVAGAFALRDVLADFSGGHVIIAVTSTPFKCPPAPSETALLMHDLITERGLSDRSSISLMVPMAVPIPPSPEASRILLDTFAERGISFHGETLVRGLDPDRNVARLSGGDEAPYDLFLGVPAHRAPQVVVDAGLTVDGWVPVDPQTLETAYPGVYAVGDVTSVGTPKAGVFAEGQAVVVAHRIAAQLRGVDPDRRYDGHGLCYLEFGNDAVAKVDVTFVAGQPPAGSLIGPSPDLVTDKIEFGSTRIHRWFGKQWDGATS